MMTRLLLQATRWQKCSMRKNVPPRRGEVWLFDCGMVAKVRPVLVLSVPFTDTDRALVTVVLHTTTLRGSQFEVKIQVPFLKEGAFVAQSIATYPVARAIRKLGALNAVQVAEVETAIFKWLVSLFLSCSRVS